jgi:hypothetical protein
MDVQFRLAYCLLPLALGVVQVADSSRLKLFLTVQESVTKLIT